MQSSGFLDVLTSGLRYVFVLLAGFVAVRSFLWLRKDAKQYRKIIRRLPDAGLIGEMLCPSTGKTVPVPREGSMGRFSSCDVKLKGNGVRGIHAHFLFVPGKGLKITPHGSRQMRVNGRNVKGSAILGNGSELVLGTERYIIRFFAGLDAPRRAETEPFEDPENGEMYGPEWGEEPLPGWYGYMYGRGGMADRYPEYPGNAPAGRGTGYEDWGEVPADRDDEPADWGEDRAYDDRGRGYPYRGAAPVPGEPYVPFPEMYPPGAPYPQPRPQPVPRDDTADNWGPDDPV